MRGTTRDSNLSWIAPWLLVVLAIAAAAVIVYPEKFIPAFPALLAILEGVFMIKG